MRIINSALYRKRRLRIIVSEYTYRGHWMKLKDDK